MHHTLSRTVPSLSYQLCLLAESHHNRALGLLLFHQRWEWGRSLDPHLRFQLLLSACGLGGWGGWCQGTEAGGVNFTLLWGNHHPFTRGEDFPVGLLWGHPRSHRKPPTQYSLVPQGDDFGLSMGPHRGGDRFCLCLPKEGNLRKTPDGALCAHGHTLVTSEATEPSTRDTGQPFVISSLDLHFLPCRLTLSACSTIFCDLQSPATIL